MYIDIAYFSDTKTIIIGELGISIIDIIIIIIILIIIIIIIINFKYN